MDYNSQIELIDRISDLVESNKRNYQDRDFLRSMYTSGKISGLTAALRYSGIQAEYGDWKADNACLRPGYLTIEGHELIKDCELQLEDVVKLKREILPKTRLTIYQINPDRDGHDVMFINHKHLEQLQGSPEIDSSIYDRVYTVEEHISNLGDVFRIFNREQPADYCGRSLSVSDVVIIENSEVIQPGAYFCDSFGFDAVAFDADRALDSPDYNLAENKPSKVVIVKPEEPAYITEMGTDLASLQAAVGGYIEATYPYEDPVGIICNEEGKLNGMAYNRAIRDPDGFICDVIAGPMVVVGLGEEDFCGLSDEMAEKYAKLFRTPEQFSYIGGRLVVTEAETRKPTLEQQAAQAREQARAKWKTEPSPDKGKDYTR